jgi:cytochrome d ubiquinol oxidase subunit II
MMDAHTIILVMAGMVAFAVGMYVILDGFDLGLGILFPFVADDRQRDQMMSSIAPFWDGNETWLVFGGIVLLSAFPLAFSVILPAVYLPLILMLLGLILRGVAFEFRFKHHPRIRTWDAAFAGGSIVAAFAQGVILGTFVQGIRVVDNRFAGGSWDWLSAFSVMTGCALVCGYTLLGAAWLFWRTSGALQERARRWLPPLLLGLLIFIGLVSVWTPISSPAIASRWFSWPNALLLSPVPVLVAACAYGAYRSLRRAPSARPFALSVVLFLLSYAGLAISLFPLLPPPSLTLFETAAAPESSTFLLPGLLILVPVIVSSTWFNYRLFRNEDRGDSGYEH